jgi:N-methylhydantoinase B
VTPGGGGYGNPRDRNRALVAADVANGKISLAAARDVYGFVVTPDSGTA